MPRIYTRVPAPERFWPKVQRSDGCWNWIGGLSKDGYGQFALTHDRPVRAHRYSFELAYGPIPAGMVICHRCDNPRCVRPDHLFAGDMQANLNDAFAKGRKHSFETAGACVRGHPFTPENTYTFPNGEHQCRVCRTLTRRRSHGRRYIDGAPRLGSRGSTLGHAGASRTSEIQSTKT